MSLPSCSIRGGRRDFLKKALAFSTTLSTGGIYECLARDTASAVPIRLGVQLWSVRKLCDKDLPGTFKALKSMGYEGIQCGGFYGCDAKEMRKLIADHGMFVAGMQKQAKEIIDPKLLPSSIEFASELGAKCLFVPWYNSKTADGWKEFSEKMSVAAEAFKKAGIRLGYHNHQHEFRDKFDGVCKWELLFRNSSPDVCQQLDIGHCRLAGEDPAKWISKYPGRIPAVHVKAGSETSGAVGGESDTVDWKSAIKACAGCGTEWYVVEAEVKPDSLDDVRASIDYLKSNVGKWL